MSESLAARGRHNALLRYRSPDDPVVVAASRELADARAEQKIRDLLAVAPPLSDATRSRLADLLRPVAEAGGSDAAA